MPEPIAYFDGHNDVALRLYLDRAGDPVGEFLSGTTKGHIDLPRARAGHFVGGLFALFSPPAKAPSFTASTPGASFNPPMPPTLPVAEAWESARGELALLLRLVERSEGQIALCRSVHDIREAMASGRLALVVHLEGADCIDEDFYQLEVLYAAGLRSLGPVWSRHNAFGFGVPFKSPGSPDQGPGLTEAGKRLIAYCNARKILIDLSHLNEAGFWDVAKLSDAPLIATHSNVHALAPSPRNLTDRQLDAIRESKGMVGLNFATSFLREDGQMRADTPVELMVKHLDALLARLGEDHVGIGSDFDGAGVPAAIGSVAGVPILFEALRAHGYDEPLLRKLGSENWLGALARTWE